MRRWTRKLKDVRGYFSDCFDDFCATIEEVCGQKTLPQMLGVSFIVVVFCLAMIVLWGALSLLIALPVWGLWNQIMPDLGLPGIGYWQSYCLTFLCAILFRGNSVHLKE
jgi:hypothetical protein